MIKLENVHSREVEAYLRPGNAKEKIYDYGLDTVQEILDNKDLFSEDEWLEIERRLNAVIKRIKKYNAAGRKAFIYDTQFEDDSLKYTDTLNTGDSLLLSSPTAMHAVNYSGVEGSLISTIKQRLLWTLADGTNYLQFYYRKIGKENLKTIPEAIQMYNDQVIRQSKLIADRDLNLFTYQQAEKKEIVEDKYPEIIACLLSNADKIVWGELSDSQKQLYLSSVVNNKQVDRYTRKQMINNVANYTTLPELEKVANDDYKVLKRFIKK